MRQSNGCSAPVPRSSAAKQWIEEIAQMTTKKMVIKVTFLGFKVLGGRQLQ